MKDGDQTRIRIKDIASLANVSIGTVDRVIHNRGEVAEDTRRQVLEIIGQMGYTPNLVAKSLASKKICRIVVLIPSSGSNNPYWEKPLAGIKQAYEEIRDFNTAVEILYYDLNDEKSFETEFYQALELQPDGLVIAPLFYDLSSRLCGHCREKGIPYVFLDVNMDGCGQLAYFGQNAVQSGYCAARLLHYGLPKNSDVLILKISSKDGIPYHLRKREEGFLKYFKEHPSEINIYSFEIDPIPIENLYATMDRSFQNLTNPRAVFVTNSKVHLVATYLSERNLSKLILMGYDLIDANVEHLENGTIDFLIGQKPEEQGYKSVIALFNTLILRKNPETVNYSPIDIITKDNIDYYKNFSF